MTTKTMNARQARYSRERRNIVIVNLVLLVTALVVVAPAAAKGLVSSIREQSDCATVRSVLTKDDARAIELAPDVDLHDDGAFQALDRQMTALENANFGVLDAHALTKSGRELLESRQKLRVLEDKAQAVKRSKQDVERFNSEFMGKAVARLQNLMKVCSTDPSARADCLEIGSLPQMSFSATNSEEELRRRFDELQVQHRAKLVLNLTHPELKKLMAEDLSAETQFIDLMQKLLGSVDTLRADETIETEMNYAVRGQHARLRQQVAGLRVYCDVPVGSSKKEVQP